jgi:hypothetical protein
LRVQNDAYDARYVLHGIFKQNKVHGLNRDPKGEGKEEVSEKNNQQQQQGATEGRRKSTSS